LDRLIGNTREALLFKNLGTKAVPMTAKQKNQLCSGPMLPADILRLACKHQLNIMCTTTLRSGHTEEVGITCKTQHAASWLYTSSTTFSGQKKDMIDACADAATPLLYTPLTTVLHRSLSQMKTRLTQQWHTQIPSTFKQRRRRLLQGYDMAFLGLPGVACL